MIRLRFLSTLALCVGLVACGRSQEQNKRTEAAYTATVSPAGEVSAHKSTPSDLAEVQDNIDAADQVNKLFPAPEPPRGVKGSRLVRLSDDGVFELADGDHVYMDGLSCSTAALDNIRKLVMDKDTVVVVARRSPGTPAPAELWSAAVWKGFREPVYSPFPETAISSGWCAAVASSTNPYNKRYEALAQKFGALRERQHAR